MTEQKPNSISDLQQQADFGDAQAQYALSKHFVGLKFQNDLALETDNETAEENIVVSMEWLVKAVENGHVDAQYALGLYYFLCSKQAQQGNLISSIISLWVMSLASGSLIDSADKLACSLAMPKLSDTNDILAFTWLEKAATQGHVEANFRLGQCYQDGIGIAKNEPMAFKYFNIAAEQGWAEAQFELAICYLEGKGVTQNSEKGIHWCKVAAEKGNADALYLLACRYLDNSKNANYDLAISLLKKASKKGLDKAKIRLLECKKKGIGVDIIDEGSLHWDLINHNHAESQYWMARYYFKGGILNELDELNQRMLDENPKYWRNFFLNKGYEKAFDWAKKAAINGVDEANLLLGFMSLYGIGTTQHYESAFSYFKQVALRDKKGIANYFLATLCETGQIQVASEAVVSDFTLHKANSKDILDFYNIEWLSTNLDDNLQDNLKRLMAELHTANGDFDAAREAAKNNPDIVKYVDQTEELEKAHKALREKEREMLSFFTHTMRNALATAPEALRQAIKLLGSDVYEKDSNHYKAINKIASLFSSLSLTDCLIDTFKQSISDPEEFVQAWKNDHFGDATPKWVLASALRQSLNRVIFMSDTSDYRKLLEHADSTSIKAIRKSFIDEVLPLNLDAQGVDKCFQWVTKHIACIEINLSDFDQINFGTNQTRFSLLFAIASELTLNALRYWDGSNTIQIRWQLIDSERYELCVKNHCQPNASSRLAGTHKGLAFIRRLVELFGEEAQFSCEVEDHFFTTQLSLNKTLFSEAL